MNQNWLVYSICEIGFIHLLNYWRFSFLVHFSPQYSSPSNMLFFYLLCYSGHPLLLKCKFRNDRDFCLFLSLTFLSLCCGPGAILSALQASSQSSQGPYQVPLRLNLTVEETEAQMLEKTFNVSWQLNSPLLLKW